MSGMDSALKSSLSVECAMCPAGRSATATRVGAVSSGSSCVTLCSRMCEADDSVCDSGCALWCGEAGGATVEVHSVSSGASASDWHFARTCHVCGAGFYQAGFGQLSCTECAAGYFQASVGQSSCLACVAGKYRNVNAASSSASSACTVCAAGTYQPQAAQLHCVACAAVN